MSAKLSGLEISGGFKTPIFNNGRPKTRPITNADLKRWKNEVGELVGDNWEAVIDGRIAVVLRIKTAK